METPLTGQESAIQSSIIQPSTAPTLMITTTSTSAAQAFYIQQVKTKMFYSIELYDFASIIFFSGSNTIICRQC